MVRFLDFSEELPLFDEPGVVYYNTHTINDGIVKGITISNRFPHPHVWNQRLEDYQVWISIVEYEEEA